MSSGLLRVGISGVLLYVASVHAQGDSLSSLPSLTDSATSTQPTDSSTPAPDSTSDSVSSPTDSAPPPTSSTPPTDSASPTDSSASPTSTTDMAPTTTPPPDNSTSFTTSSSASSSSFSPPPVLTPSGSNNHTGAIAGGVVGGVAFIALVVFAIFFYKRRRAASIRRGSNSFGDDPFPSPSFRSKLGFSGHGKGKRLKSVGGDTAPTSPNQSLDSNHISFSVTALGADGAELAKSSPSPVARRSSITYVQPHRSLHSQSRTSIPANADFDLKVFNDQNADAGYPNAPPEPTSGSDRHSHDSSRGGAESSSSVVLTRKTSGNRVPRKAVPNYPLAGDDRSRPPTTKPGHGHMSRTSVVLQDIALNHKSSTGTFRFPGEKEGPVHYLIPDPLPPPSV